MRRLISRLLWRLQCAVDPEKSVLQSEFALRSIDEAVRVRAAARGVAPEPSDGLSIVSIAWEDAYGEIAELRRKYVRACERSLEFETKLRDAEARAAGRNDWRGRGGIQC